MASPTLSSATLSALGDLALLGGETGPLIAQLLPRVPTSKALDPTAFVLPGTIRFWSSSSGACLSTVDTRSQVYNHIQY